MTAIFSDELASRNVSDTASPEAFRVSWTDAVRAAHAFHVYRPFDVEIALGEDFERIRGRRWRTVAVAIQLPQCVIDALRLIEFIPPSDSISARAERLLCRTVEDELVLRGTRDALR